MIEITSVFVGIIIGCVLMGLIFIEELEKL